VLHLEMMVTNFNTGVADAPTDRRRSAAPRTRWSLTKVPLVRPQIGHEVERENQLHARVVYD